jgi:putative Ca2+/H+ antiporter (TMEM165/GDT1 family)
MWDLRLPSGLFFALLGAILCGVAVLAPRARAPLSEFNVNLYSGITFLVFGGVLLWLAKRKA